MMRYIIANWKMNMGLPDITAWLEAFKLALPQISQEKVVIVSPSFPYLGMLADVANSINIKLAAQNISLLDRGPHTGETGAFQVKDFCPYCIVGHSELKENIEDSIKKRDLCLTNGITPIFCFVNISDAARVYKPKVILAWEDPTNISAQGQYRAKPKAEIQQGIDKIRKLISSEAELIYGGSVNRENIEDLSQIKGLNGILPGNASKDATHFAELVVKF